MANKATIAVPCPRVRFAPISELTSRDRNGPASAPSSTSRITGSTTYVMSSRSMRQSNGANMRIPYTLVQS